MKAKRLRPLRSIADLAQDDVNSNRGTVRGAELIAQSIDAYGFGKSIVVARGGKILAGNQVAKAARRKGAKIRVVDSAGDELIVVRRTDVDDDSPKARELGVIDNEAGRVSLSYDPQALQRMKDAGARLETIFDEKTFARLLGSGSKERKDLAAIPQSLQLKPAREYVVVVCADDDGAEWEALKDALALRPVRRGGYKAGSPFEAVGMQRVVPAADLLARLNGKKTKR